MSVTMIPPRKGVTRISFEGKSALRAYEFAAMTLPGKRKEVRDKLLNMYRANYPNAMFMPAKGSGVPSGYYFFECDEGSVKAFLEHPANIKEAEDANKLGAFYGAGRRNGGIKISAGVLGEVVEITSANQARSLLEALSAQVLDLLAQNETQEKRILDLAAQRDKAIGAADKLRRQMIEGGLKPRHRVAAGRIAA